MKAIRISKIMASALIIALCLWAMPSNMPGRAQAESVTELAFDRTDALDDLKSSEEFDLLDYPYKESAKPQMIVINVAEYCYSYIANRRENYGLYIYLYNPGNQKIVENSIANTAQIAVSYDEEGEPNDFESFGLKFCNYSSDPVYYRLFYKFRVIDHKSRDGKTLVERVNSLERRYDISGVELLTEGNANATDYPVCGTYRFRGYAAGYGPDEKAESTLTSDADYLETINLDVKHTFYRTETSARKDHQNQIDTVYFAVPKRYFDEYGSLQRIKAEWWEYRTREIVVTSDEGAYNAIMPFVGKNIGEHTSALGYELDYDQRISTALTTYGWTYNIKQYSTAAFQVYSSEICDKLVYLFGTRGWESISEYDPYAEDIEAQGGVSSNRLYEYIRNYDKSYDGGRLPVKDGTISADLFESDIDESRKMDNECGKIQKGYSYYDFDADLDLQSWQTWGDIDHYWYEDLWAWWNKVNTSESGQEISPIRVLEPNCQEMKLGDDELTKELLINASDIADFRAFYNDAISVSGSDDEESYVVLFRFAVTDYFSGGLGLTNSGADRRYEDRAYMARQSVFLDFDIIQLTFYKDGIYHVIPVVSDPIDIVNGITPPAQLPEDTAAWWKLLLGIIAVVLLLLLSAPILPVIIRVSVWAICLPFRLLGRIIKAYGAARKKRKERKRLEKQEKSATERASENGEKDKAPKA